MSYTCFAENAIQWAKDEDKLFESLLKIDFRRAQILKEADLDAQTDPDDGEDVKTMDYSEGEASEQVKKKLFEKIGEKAKKVLEWLKAALGKVAEKFKEFFYKDSKLVDTFKDALSKKENLAKFEGVKNFAPANVDFNLSDLLSKMADITDALGNGTFLTDTNWENKCKKLAYDCKGAIGEEVEAWNAYGNVGPEYFTKAIKLLQTNQLTKDVFTIYKKVANKSYQGVKPGKEGFDAQKAIYGINLASVAAKTFINTYVQYFKAIRHAVIVCGTAALRAAKGGDQAKNEALVWMVSTQSEQHLNESFAFI